jgi:hypothetical protein
VKLRDIFIRSFLGNKTINRESLIIAMKYELRTDDKPILECKVKDEEMEGERQKDEELILFIDHPQQKDNEEVSNFLTINKKEKVYLESNKSITRVGIKIIPIYIYCSLEFN